MKHAFVRVGAADLEGIVGRRVYPVFGIYGFGANNDILVEAEYIFIQQDIVIAVIGIGKNKLLIQIGLIGYKYHRFPLTYF